MKQNRSDENGRPEYDAARRFHIEDTPDTSGQAGPKSKRRVFMSKGPPTSDTPDTSPPMRDASVTPGQHGPKLKGRASTFKAPPISDTPDAPPPMRDASATSGQHGPKYQNSKYRQYSEQARPSDRLRHEGEPPPGGDGGPAANGGGTSSDKQTWDSTRFEKSKFRAEKTGVKQDAAREKLAAQKPPRPPGLGKTLGWAAKTEAWAYVHGKIRQVERENVGTEAAHKTELAGESAGRAATRFIKRRISTHPARRVAKLEKSDIRARADYQYRKMVQENPQLKSNVFSRYLQKRQVKKQYQKEARAAAKKTAVTTEKITRAAVGFVKRHPAGVLIALLAFLLIVSLQSCMTSMVSIGNGLAGAIGAATYPAKDSDMQAAEAAYSGMEAKLQNEADNYETLHPGYDEYHYDLDTIEHDPYVLISILSALHEGAWTVDEVQDTLSMLFAEQYQLTQTVQTEVRYRTETETVTDADGTTHTETHQVPYTYTICTVTLHNEDLSHIPVEIMMEEQLSRYALYMKTLGNRPDLFPQSQYPNASTLKSYTDYDIPAEYMSDETFAAMITEAKKYLGYPYVWGGSSPETSFDCSGYVSWVINHSGWNVGRLGAQGLYDICTPISASSAKPGDLVFFTGTYDTPGISHVGIYVGDGMMIAAGDPIGYSDITTSYWQSHFYAFGRLP